MPNPFPDKSTDSAAVQISLETVDNLLVASEVETATQTDKLSNAPKKTCTDS